MDRREFINTMGIAFLSGFLPRQGWAKKRFPGDFYDLPNFGNARLLHITDCHAQLEPIHFREPSINLGFGQSMGNAPHLVGTRFLEHFKITPDSPIAHAFTHLNFSRAAQQYGKMGGFAHLKTLVDRLRTDYGTENTLLLDGGDTWQGSGTAYKTQGMDMVRASNALGVDIMTGHWEFTYHQQQILDNLAHFKGEFLAQNVLITEDALFDGLHEYIHDEDSMRVFKPYSIRTLGGARIAIIGQAFPRLKIANPARFVPDWTFDIHDDLLQELVDEVRTSENADAVVVLSHNGMDVDISMARRVHGIDVILGGHTHDGIPAPTQVKHNNNTTLVCNAGSNGKFLGVLDLDIRAGKVRDFRYKMMPVFANLLPAEKHMATLVAAERAPYLDWLNEELGQAEQLLFRRGNFNGSFDQVICDALRAHYDAEIALSPGFRWGTSVLAGQTITMERVLDQTCINYPQTYSRKMSGKQIKLILEDVADNLFNLEPYLQSGGDMVRLGGLDYRCNPAAKFGHRIDEMRLNSGHLLEPDKEYRVAGWATVGAQSEGPDIWDVVAEYMRQQQVIRVDRLNTPRLVNVSNNPGYEA